MLTVQHHQMWDIGGLLVCFNIAVPDFLEKI